MGPDLDTLATALYPQMIWVEYPGWAPERPVVGIVPKLSPGGDGSTAAGLTPLSSGCGPCEQHILTPQSLSIVPRICGWWTQLRSSAAAAARPPAARSWRDGRNTATARRIPGTFGGCVSTFWLPHRVCRSCGRLLRPKKTNTSPWRCWRSGLAGPDHHRGQGLRRASFENTLNGAGITLIRPATKTETATRAAVPSPFPPDHRVDPTPSKPSLISNGTADVPKPV